jgi:hypothetical protein
MLELKKQIKLLLILFTILSFTHNKALSKNLQTREIIQTKDSTNDLIKCIETASTLIRIIINLFVYFQILSILVVFVVIVKLIINKNFYCSVYA